jgi:hypothetical protein
MFDHIRGGQDTLSKAELDRVAGSEVLTWGFSTLFVLGIFSSAYVGLPETESFIAVSPSEYKIAYLFGLSVCVEHFVVEAAIV